MAIPRVIRNLTHKTVGPFIGPLFKKIERRYKLCEGKRFSNNLSRTQNYRRFKKKPKRIRHSNKNMMINLVLGTYNKKKVTTQIPQRLFDKSNKQLGWIKLPRGVTIKRNGNPFVKSISKLFKTKKNYLSQDHTKLYCMPARQAEMIGMFMFMSSLEGQITLKDLDPKIISKIIFMIKVMDYGINKPDDVPMQVFKSQVDHTYLKPLKEGESRYNKFANVKFDEKMLTMTEGKGNCTEEVMSIINSEVNKYGGWIEYCKLNAQQRPDAMSVISKLNTSDKYDIEPCGLVPIKVCQVCGTINTYSHYECPPSKIHKSLGHYRPGKETCNETFESTGNKDTLESAPWRCCSCLSDLNILVIGNVNWPVILTCIEWAFNFKIAGDLDELLKQGYGDVYEFCDPEKRASIKTHDNAVITDYFLHLRRKIIPCGNDLDQLSRRALIKLIGGLFFKPMNKLNNIKPELIAEISILNEVMRQATIEDDIAIIGDPLPHNQQDKYHQWYADDNMFAIDRASPCSAKTICDHKGPMTVLGSFCISKVGLPWLLKIVDKQRSMPFISPIIKGNGSLNDGTGKLITEHEKTLLFLDGNPVPFSFNTDTWVAMNNYDMIVSENNIYIITKLRSLHLLELKVITGPYTSFTDLPKHFIYSLEVKSINLPLPNVERFLGNMAGFNFEMCNFELDAAFFRYLCIRNLSGKVSHETLREYAVGFALRRFVIHNKVIANPFIVYESIDIHIILCRICMLIMRGNYNTNYNFIEFMQNLGPLKVAVASLDPIITSVIIKCFSDFMSGYLGVSINNIIQMMKECNISIWLEGLCKDQFWEDLLMVASEIRSRPLKTIIVESYAVKPEEHVRSHCSHHTNKCNHIEKLEFRNCNCCFLRITKSNFCECCKPSTTNYDLKYPDKWAKEESKEKKKEPPRLNETIKMKSENMFDSLKKKISKLDDDISKIDSFPKLKQRTVKLMHETRYEPDKKFSDTEKQKESYQQDKREEDQAKTHEFESKKESDDGKIGKEIIEEFTEESKDGTPFKEEDIEPLVEPTVKDDIQEPESAKESESIVSELREQEFEKPGLSADQRITEDVTILDEEGWKIKMKKIRREPASTQRTGLMKIVDEVSVKNLDTEAIRILGLDFIRHVYYPIQYEEELNAALTCKYYLPHVLNNISITTGDVFEVLEYYNVPNTDINTCGMDAINKCLDLDITLTKMRSIIGAKEPFSDFDLLKIAELYNENLIINSSRHTLIGKYNKTSDEFGCIHLSGVEDVNDIGHFSACKLKRIKPTGIYLCCKNPDNYRDREFCLQSITNSKINIMNPGDLQPDLNIKNEIIFCLGCIEDPITTTLKPLEVILKGGNYYITNNEKFEVHNPAGDLVHVKIPKYLEHLHNHIKLCLSGTIEDVKLPEIMHNINALPSDWEKVLKDDVLECLRGIIRVHNQITNCEKEKLKIILKGSLIPWFNYCNFRASRTYDFKLKKYDLVGFKTPEGIISMQVITVTDNVITLNKTIPYEIVGELLETKESMGSYIRRLIGLMQEPIKMKEFERILNDSKCVIGPAGYGKSTRISQECSTDSVCIAMTTTSVESLKEKIGKGPKILSLEKALWNHVKAYNDLYIDECTMIGWQSILLLCTESTQLHLYGAKNQVGFVDMSATAGVRYNQSIINFIQPSNIVEENTTYRIGEPLITFIRDLEPNIVTKALHETTYNISNLESHQLNLVKVIATKTRPDVVITPYNFNKRLLAEMLYDLKIPVVTTHAFQGKEVNRSMVVLKPNSNGQWELNTDSRYLNSSLTRAKYHVEIVIIGYPNTNISKISDIMSRVGGKQEVTNPKIESLNKTQIEDLNDDLKCVTIRNMHKLKKTDVDKLNSMCLKMGAMNIHYSKLNGGTECRVEKFKNTFARISNINGEITIDAPEFIKSKILKELDTKLEISEDKLLSLDKHTKTMKQVLDVRASNKLRELTWILDKTVDGQMTLSLNKSLFTFTKTKGCPLFSGLLVKCEGKFLSISDGWENIFERNIQTNINSGDETICVIVEWLDIKIDGINIVSRDFEWLQHIRGDNMTTVWQTEERLSKLHLWLVNKINDDGKPGCLRYNQRNVYYHNQCTKLFWTAEKIDKHQSVISHKNLIINTKTAFFFSRYNLVNIDGIISSVKTNSDSKTIGMFIIDALQDINEKPKDEIKGINADVLNIPGLIIPLSQHLQEDGAIKSYIMQQFADIKLLTKTSRQDIIRVDSLMIENFKHYIKDKFPSIILSPCNYEMLGSPLEHVMEQIMLNSVGSLGKSKKGIVVYAGSQPITCAIVNKYYIKLRIPGVNEYSRVTYDRQILMIDNMFKQYTKHKEGEFSLEWDATTNPEKLLLGTDAITYDESLLKELLNKSYATYAWVPMNRQDHQHFYKIDKINNIISYKGSFHSKIIKNELMIYASHGRPFFHNDDESYYFQASTILEAFEHKLIKIMKHKYPVTGKIKCAINTYQDLYGYKELIVPWLNFNIINMVKTGKIIELKHLRVNKPMLRNMLLRLATNDDSEDSILAYARTLETTQIISENNIQDVYGTDIPILLSTSWAALYIHKNYKAKFDMLIKLVNSAANSKIVLSLLENIIPGLLKMTSIVTNVIESEVVEMITKFVQNNGFMISEEDIKKINLDMSWLAYQPKRKIVTYYFGDMIKCDVQPIDGDDEDFMDNTTTKIDDDKEVSPNEFMNENFTEPKSYTASTHDEEEGEDEINDQDPNEDDGSEHSNYSTADEGEDENAQLEETKDKDSSDKTPEKRDEPESKVEEPEEEEKLEKELKDDTIDKNYDSEMDLDSTEDETGLLREMEFYIYNLDRLNKKDWAYVKTRVSGFKIRNVDKIKKRLKEINQPFATMLMGELFKLIQDIVDNNDVNEGSYVKLNNEIKPKNVEYITRYGKRLPKILWAYWDTEEITVMIDLCLKSWAEMHPDFRIVLITDKVFSNYINKFEREMLISLPAQRRSDWIRLRMLADFGGIWIDASTFIIRSLDPLIEAAMNHNTGMYQPSLRDRSHPLKYYESWLIVCTENNRIMADWYELMAKMLKKCHYEGISNLDALREMFDDETMIIGTSPILPYLQEYLSVYICQIIILYRSNVHCIASTDHNECKLTIWYALDLAGWMNLWKLVAEDNKESLVEYCIVKLIHRTRVWIEKDINKPTVPGSLMHWAKNLKPINYDIRSMQGLIHPTRSRIELQNNFLNRSNTICLLVLGSSGDVMPYIRIYDILEAMGLNCLIITHDDHKNICGDRNMKPNNSNSMLLMQIANNIMNKKQLLSSVDGMKLMKRITSRTIEILDSEYKINTFIYNPMYPSVDNLKRNYGNNWICCNPFPIEWTLGREDESLFKWKTKVSQIIMNQCFNEIMSALNYEIKQKEYNEISPILTYPTLLMPETRQQTSTHVGYINMGGWSEYTKMKQINLKYVLINLGSCMENLTMHEIETLLKTLVNLKQIIVLKVNENIPSPYSRLQTYIENNVGTIRLVKQMNFESYKHISSFAITHGGIGTINDCLFHDIIPLTYDTIADQTEWGRRLELYNIGGRVDRNNLQQSLMHHLGRETLYKQEWAKIKCDHHLNVMELYKKFSYNLKTENIRLIKNINVDMNIALLTNDDVKYNQNSKFTKYGIFECFDFKYTTVYSPDTPLYCVKECLLRFLNDSGREKFLSLSISSVSDLRQERVNYEQLISGLLSLGLNFIVKHPLHETLIVKVFESPMIGLCVVEKTNSYHCELVVINHTGTLESMIIIPRPADIQIECERIIRDVLKLSHNINELMDPIVLLKRSAVNRLKELRERVKLRGIQSLGARGDHHVKIIRLTKDKIFYRGDIKAKNSLMQVYCVSSYSGWMIVTGFIHEGSIYLISDEPLSRETVIINLHFNLISPKDVKIIKENYDYLSINPETVTVTRENQLFPRSNKIVSPDSFNYKLVIADFDNRSHHNVNYLMTISNSVEVHVHCEPKISISEILRTFDHAINRMVIKNCKLYYVIDFKNVNSANTLKQLDKECVRISASLFKSNKFEQKLLDKLMVWFKIEGSSLVEKARIKTDPTTITKDELLNVIRDNIADATIMTLALNAVNALQSNTFIISNDSTTEIPIRVTDNCIQYKSSVIYLPYSDLLIRSETKGGGTMDELDLFHWTDVTDPSNSRTTNQDWWGIREPPKNDDKVNFKDMEAFNEMEIHDCARKIMSQCEDPNIYNEDNLLLYLPPYLTVMAGDRLEPLTDVVTAQNMDLWENRDLTMWLSAYAPINDSKIFTRETIGKIINSEKITLTKYPTKSRPVLTKVCFEELRSIIGRLKSVAYIRKMIPDKDQLVLKLADTYFCNDWRRLVASYQSDMLIINSNDVNKWIKENKDCPRIVKEMLKTLSGQILVDHISDVKVHLKNESLLKDEPIEIWQKQQARIIVWQRKSICAIYSEVFKQAKDRLKAILHNKIIYADGMRPDQLSNRVRLCSNVVGFFENDLTKQDRQTDKPIIDVEMEIYMLLGVHPKVIASWKEMHEDWRFKSEKSWGQGVSMRLTGQATTAIGNCITNLQVHENFVRNNKSYLELALFLGDDMCMIFNQLPNMKNLKKDIAVYFNMQSKESWNTAYGNFCSMICCKSPGNRAELCPDVVRLKFRYEVTNGVSEMTESNFWMRKASYLMMLGNAPHVRQTIIENNMPIKPVDWYNYYNMLQGVAAKYNMNEMHVEGYYHQLITLLRSNNIYRYNFRMFGKNKQ